MNFPLSSLIVESSFIFGAMFTALKSHFQIILIEKQGLTSFPEATRGPWNAINGMIGCTGGHELSVDTANSDQTFGLTVTDTTLMPECLDWQGPFRPGNDVACLGDNGLRTSLHIEDLQFRSQTRVSLKVIR